MALLKFLNCQDTKNLCTKPCFMNKILYFILFLSPIIFCKTAIAQAPPNIGHFYGKIIDETTSKPIENATVQLLQSITDTTSKKQKNILIATVLTSKNGDFSMDKLPVMGAFILHVTIVGFKLLTKEVAFDMSNTGIDKDLGNIKITRDPQQLQNVTVSANKPLLELALDKKVYNVEKDISTVGGTAIDVMKKIPSVTVGIDGNVTMRNATPQILIDGRPTTLLLDQIPADQIQAVEIMTNPSAKYDAGGGGAGILNIILKKNRKNGYNGSIYTGIDKRAQPYFNGDLNIKKNKINFFVSTYIGFRKIITNTKTQRTDFLGFDSTASFSQSNKPNIKGMFDYGRMGFDYLVDNRNTITLAGTGVSGHFTPVDFIHITSDTIAPSTNYLETATRALSANIHFRNYGSIISYKHIYARPGKEWTADANYINSENTNTSDYQSKLYDQFGNPKQPLGAQRATGGTTTNNITLQTDYVDPFTPTQKIEFGFRAAIRKFHNYNDNYLQDVNTLIYILQPLIGVNYNYRDEIYAGYFTYSKQIKKFSYQAGLRIESSKYQGDYITKNQQFSNQYPFSLFPSAYLDYKIKESQDMQLNFSRKINRPNFFQVVPFVDFSDSLNLAVGNPNLKPEFTWMGEWVYSNQYNAGNSLLVSLYGKLTSDLITRYQFDSLINPAKMARYITYANASRANTIGLEITNTNKIAKWWNVTSNFNLYNTAITSSNLPGVTNSNLTSWFAKINNTFKLPKDFTIQLSGDYQSKTLIPASSSSGSYDAYTSSQINAQGYLKPTYGVDIAISKDIFKNHSGSITLEVSDIFRTRIEAIHANTPLYLQDNWRLRDPQMIRLNFGWRFGKFDLNVFKRKNMKGEQEAIQGVQSAGQ